MKATFDLKHTTIDALVAVYNDGTDDLPAWRISAYRVGLNDTVALAQARTMTVRLDDGRTANVLCTSTRIAQGRADFNVDGTFTQPMSSS